MEAIHPPAAVTAPHRQPSPTGHSTLAESLVRWERQWEPPHRVAPVPGDPDATIELMESVVASALGAALPTPERRQVANRAQVQAVAARIELGRARARAHTGTADDDARDHRVLLERYEADGLAHTTLFGSFRRASQVDLSG